MVQELKNGPHQGDQSIEPVYSVKENITVKTMRKLIQEAVRSHLPSAEDPLPEKLRTAYKLLSYQEAVKAMHKPESREALKSIDWSPWCGPFFSSCTITDCLCLSHFPVTVTIEPIASFFFK